MKWSIFLTIPPGVWVVTLHRECTDLRILSEVSFDLPSFRSDHLPSTELRLFHSPWDYRSMEGNPAILSGRKYHPLQSNSKLHIRFGQKKILNFGVCL